MDTLSRGNRKDPYLFGAVMDPLSRGNRKDPYLFGAVMDPLSRGERGRCAPVSLPFLGGEILLPRRAALRNLLIERFCGDVPTGCENEVVG